MKLSLLDICLPDYFRGYHKPVLQVPVSNTTTPEELKESLLSEIHMVFDHLSYEGAWPDIDYEPLVDAFITATPGIAMFPDLEDDSEDELCDSVYIFICLENGDDD